MSQNNKIVIWLFHELSVVGYKRTLSYVKGGTAKYEDIAECIITDRFHVDGKNYYDLIGCDKSQLDEPLVSFKAIPESELVAFFC